MYNAEEEKPVHGWFPKMEASRPKEAAIPSEACSLGEAVMSLIADESIKQLFITRGYSDRDDIDSMSSGSMSPDRIKGLYQSGISRSCTRNLLLCGSFS